MFAGFCILSVEVCFRKVNKRRIIMLEALKKDNRVHSYSNQFIDDTWVEIIVQRLKRTIREWNGFCVFTEVNHITKTATVYFVDKY